MLIWSSLYTANLMQVLDGKEDALHLASQHTQVDENQRSLRGFLCPAQPMQPTPGSSDFQPVRAPGMLYPCV